MNSKIIPAVLGVSLIGVTAFVVYLLYKKEKEGEENVEITTKGVTVEMLVPMEVIPSLIGRGGNNIKKIERDTGTHIYFKDMPSKGLESEIIKERICIIRGSSDNVENAQRLIKENMQEKADHVDSTISVPQWAVSSIIGRGGNNIRDIQHQSGAKIKVEDFSGHTAAQRKVSVKGTKDQIKKASDAIESVISSEKLRREKEMSMSRREPRKKNQPPASLTGGTDDNDSGTALNASSALESPSPDTGALLEVFVSAISSPSRFWVQIVGKQTEELEKLVDQMTDYYSNPENRDFHKPSDIYVGKIVAAVFRHDSRWYRAKVVTITPSEFDSRKQVCDLYFVDYGDNEYVAKDELYELRTDMLRLKFQAMECYLSGVAPIDRDEQESEPYPKWDPRAIERFEDLSQVARWKRLWSRTCSFKVAEPLDPLPENASRTTREGSPIPGVKLYDVKDGRDIDIAQTLIDEGYAKAVEEKSLERVTNAKAPAPAPVLPPTFGDLECSRILGGFDGREERAASLPHRGPPSALPSDFQGEGMESAKPKSFSIATGIQHNQPMPYVEPHLAMNGSAKPTNGSAHHNESFINSEKGVHPESSKHHFNDDFKAKINRVDSHHSLSRQTPESPRPFLPHDPKDDLKAKINRVDSHHGNLEALGHTPPFSALHPPPKVTKPKLEEEKS